MKTSTNALTIIHAGMEVLASIQKEDIRVNVDLDMKDVIV